MVFYLFIIDMTAFKDVAKDTDINYGKQKANETLTDQEKFKSTLEKIKTNDGFKKIKGIRDSCEESDKEKIYKAGQQMGKSIPEKILDPLGLGIVQTTKQADPTLATIQMLRYKNNKIKWLKAACPPQTFETTMRFMVQLWLLDAPQKVTPEAMLSDLQSDTKSVNMKLTAFEAIATVVPYLRPLLPFIQLLRQYVKKLGEASVQKVMADQFAQQEAATSPEYKENQVTKTTKEWTTVLGSNVQEEKIKEYIVDNLSTKTSKKTTDPAVSQEAQQQVKHENAGTPMPKEDAVEKVAQ